MIHSSRKKKKKINEIIPAPPNIALRGLKLRLVEDLAPLRADGQIAGFLIKLEGGAGTADGRERKCALT